MFGTALLYGDGLITPAISVLSAVEGFEVATTAFEDVGDPGRPCVILVGLFARAAARHRAASRKVFGPVMVVWFAVLGVLGLRQIVEHPERARRPCRPELRRRASSPTEPGKAFLALGSIFLVVTGGEALYADMGHFGRRPIQLVVVRARAARRCCSTTSARPRCCVDEPGRRSSSPFYRLAPDWAVTPLAVLATMATSSPRRR